MDRELEEAEVLWPDRDVSNGGQQQQQRRRSIGKQQAHGDAARAGGASRPVGIPAAIRAPATEQTAAWARSYCGADGDGAASGSGSFVPPHELMAARRRCAEAAASSVCEGQGRTLKGRDLRSVRNAVLRMTGFLES
ncbi:uncharacterized protein LOC100827973 [Brachypodium distachyon]|uniref:Uncharacterized protein n=1 Tax=Brachypodium distachyon TaxID=15368 RepID=I1HHJ4_BRADI|nr:uncharacterized protein LOC100827973 [Brachypodium distachyon]KQK05357.1 hypothetical protein BRADI_2g19620v3 [Brachypodium distachyon]|eukprot:XP_003566034.1 uncharacterized protein LOC100827973 [Brachypodium distachyon]